MEDILKFLNSNWEMRYTTYVDDLYLFAPNYYAHSRERIDFNRDGNDIVIGFCNNEGIYLKIENASKHLGDGMEKKTKAEIINNLRELIYA